MTKKKYPTRWTTYDEILFLKHLQTFDVKALIAYKLAMRLRKNWGEINKQRIEAFLRKLGV